ncbi:hypothetical protein SAMN05216464_113102 [Mucilaginibacter pineti]|uniref:Helix-turn-helix domain-containing protein n=1 Tax=Mucilaginibacter pineti TaxID=1391627 RepID=A0A1G7IP59_9SPHI|nr:helix-turn-helix domain-containing protein [Mucilaginibacter pineti]SDF14336.1 hypothetical protein SAMN05216464_113102 [Mucilaginibacter pineti]
MEMITLDDLRQFRLQLLNDIKALLNDRPTVVGKDMPVEWVKSPVARRMLDVSPGTLQNLRISGRLGFQRLGGSYYYSLKDLNGLFQNNATTASNPGNYAGK